MFSPIFGELSIMVKILKCFIQLNKNLSFSQNFGVIGHKPYIHIGSTLAGQQLPVSYLQKNDREKTREGALPIFKG